jgi:hypothetical protein
MNRISSSNSLNYFSICIFSFKMFLFLNLEFRQTASVTCDGKTVSRYQLSSKNIIFIWQLFELTLMASKAHDDPETSEEDQGDQSLPKPVAERDPEQAKGILERIQDFISSIGKGDQPYENGQKLNCPSCRKNCHTLHQEGTESLGKPDQLEKILSKGKKTRSSQNPPGLKLSCLHCGSLCHVVADLSSKGLPQQQSSDKEKEPEESQTPAEASDQEEGAKDPQSPDKATDQESEEKKSPTHSETSVATDAKQETLMDKILYYLRSTPHKTKFDCPHCDKPCHSIDINEPETFLQMIGKLLPLSNGIKKETEATKQTSSNSYFVGKLKCGSCDKFCHRIYKHDPDYQDSEAGQTIEEELETTNA